MNQKSGHATLVANTPYENLAEDQLLTLAMEYDEGALGELYDRYQTKIFTYIYRRTGEQNLAEDLTAQVFLKMLEAIQNRRAWHSSFSGWLYRIAHNIVIDFYRRRSRVNQISIDEKIIPGLPTSNENPARDTEKKLDAEDLRSAIQRLTDEQGVVVSLRFLEGYSIAEVAKMMGKTEGAVKALQYRAVSTLKILLAHDYR